MSQPAMQYHQSAVSSLKEYVKASYQLVLVRPSTAVLSKRVGKCKCYKLHKLNYDYMIITICRFILIGSMLSQVCGSHCNREYVHDRP